MLERPRRLRRGNAMRDLVQEHRLDKRDFVQPLFVCEGTGVKNEIPSMPGQYRLSIDKLIEKCGELFKLGINAVLLFGIPSEKDTEASQAWREDGIIQRAVRELKVQIPDMVVITDTCVCEYTDNGHCGFLSDDKLEVVENDKSVELSVKVALSQAEAGADIVAPSSMMDGVVQEIRKALDKNGFKQTAIMGYTVKYASAFYGPFRDAAGSSPEFGDRKSYQMDPANSREAEKELRLELLEGVDIVMVKPALSYMDVISKIRATSDKPVAVYNVSGEYSMVAAAAEKGWIDREKVVWEVLLSLKRAGADIIITYHAEEMAKILSL